VKSTGMQLSIAGVIYANTEEGTRIIDEIKQSSHQSKETSTQLFGNDNDEAVYPAQQADTKTISSDAIKKRRLVAQTMY
jgi:hypothetical protein